MPSRSILHGIRSILNRSPMSFSHCSPLKCQSTNVYNTLKIVEHKHTLNTVTKLGSQHEQHVQRQYHAVSLILSISSHIDSKCWLLWSKFWFLNAVRPAPISATRRWRLLRVAVEKAVVDEVEHCGKERQSATSDRHPETPVEVHVRRSEPVDVECQQRLGVVSSPRSATEHRHRSRLHANCRHRNTNQRFHQSTNVARGWFQSKDTLLSRME